MKAFRAVSLVVSLCLLAPAWAEVRLMHGSQSIGPLNSSYVYFDDVAIDGGYIIVLAHTDYGKEAAFLYRRSISTGRFSFHATLLAVNASNVTSEVVMKNGIAAIRIGTQVTLFENSGGTYVPAHTVAPLSRPGGLAISGSSVLAGGDGCTDDAVVYQKGADGNWGITGRIDDHQGECHPEGLKVDLYYDYALVTVPHADRATAWRRNGTALDWLPAGTLNLPPGAEAGEFPFVLEGSTAVSPGGYVFRRSGSTWTRTDRAMGVDFYGHSNAFGAVQLVYGGGILATHEATDDQGNQLAHLFQETSPGHFQNLEIQEYPSHSTRIDLSGHTLVISGDSLVKGGINGPPYYVGIYDLPTPLAAPTPVVDDFEDGKVSDFTFSGGQFALASRGKNHVLAQSNPSGLALALATNSDWTREQIVDADVTSANTNPDGWVGLVAKYVDSNNFYYVTVSGNVTVRLYKRVNGVDTLLHQLTFGISGPISHVNLTVKANGEISAQVNDNGGYLATDTTFTHGRAGLATFQIRADFDNVNMTGTFYVSLLNKEFDYWLLGGQDFTEEGGTWQQLTDANHNNVGFAQTDPTAWALAHIGVPTQNTEVDARLRVDSFDSSVTSGWVALLARYQDPNNYYYAAIRSTNQIQIRKVVNGVTSVLAAAPFTVQPGVYHQFSLSVINDQLHLLVDGALVAAAHDGAFSTGQYGIGTYRATATWTTLSVIQP